uniref:Uncharacterized protein n=1 Tax=Plectus sambesii TaxID=2011161 RepID=A0A914VKL2_9BILA
MSGRRTAKLDKIAVSSGSGHVFLHAAAHFSRVIEYCVRLLVPRRKLTLAHARPIAVIWSSCSDRSLCLVGQSSTAESSVAMKQARTSIEFSPCSLF